MRAFLDLYPYIVMTIGLLTAVGFTVEGFYVSMMVLRRGGDWFDNGRGGRIAGAAVIIAFSNGAAVTVLAFTRWVIVQPG